MRSSTLSKLRLTIFGLFVGVFFAEIMLRHYIILEPTSYRLDESTLYEIIPNSEMFYKHVPENGGEFINLKFNKFGFRGEELVENPETLRIAVYGDSFIEGSFSNIEDTFSEKLEQALKQKCKSNVEVINAGVNGYGPDQIFRKIQGEIEWLSPDVIILSIYSGNDYGDLIRNKMFRLSQTGTLEVNSFYFSEEIRKGFEEEQKFAIVELARAVFNKVKALEIQYPANPQRDDQSNTFLSSFLAQNKKEFSEYILDGNNEIVNLRYDYYDADIALEPYSESAKYKIALMRQIIEQIITFVTGYNTPLVVMVIPSHIDIIDDPFWHIDQKHYPQYDPERLSLEIEKFTIRQGLPTLNLYDLFMHHEPKQLYYGYGNNHWNPRGQEVAAEAMKDFLIRSEIIVCDR